MHIPQWGTFVTSEVDLQKKEARVKAQIEVTNQSGKSVDLIVQNSIIDCQGKEVNKSGTTLTVPSLETKEVETYMDVRQVDLWSLKTPTLYTLHTDILLDGAVVDSYDTSSVSVTSVSMPTKVSSSMANVYRFRGYGCHQDHALVWGLPFLTS